MQLLAEDIEDIGHILARRYFKAHGWKYTDLRSDGKRIIDSVETINEQYGNYPELGRDWYVENSADKNVHLATTWDQLNILVGLLHTWPQQFDFLLSFNTQRSLCIVRTLQSELNSQQEKAIADARKANFNVYIFKAAVPDSMDFDLEEVVGGISGKVNFQ